MPSAPPYADYDSFARVYNKYWGSQFTDRVLPVLEKLVLKDLPAGVRILDVCCGTGQLAAALLKRGFPVTGIDESVEMIRFARENAPGAEFLVADARSFRVPPSYGAALSTYDSLNHVMTLAELTSVFRNVHGALHDRGLFVFDLNMEEGYAARWRGEFAIIEQGFVLVARSSYDAREGIARIEFIMFQKDPDGQWKRFDVALQQKRYLEEEVTSALEAVGFRDVRVFDARRDLGLQDAGRSFFVCRK